MKQYLRYKKWYKVIKESGLFDAKYYLFTYSDVRQKGINPIKHYLKYGADEGRNPSAEFDTNFYLDANLDVQETRMNPLAHYVLYGRNEGRAPCLNPKEKNYSVSSNETPQKRSILSSVIEKTEILTKYQKEGKKKYDKSKKTVIFVSHESSATGAPLLGLNMGKVLSEKYNLIHFVMKKANIHSEFEQDCFLLIENTPFNSPDLYKDILSKCKSKYDIECVLCNSVVTFHVLQAASQLKLPTISLIHEFAEYTKPEDRMLSSLVSANKVILPANIIKNSILEQLKQNFAMQEKPNNIEILPQGKLFHLPESYGENDNTESLYKKLNITYKDRANTKIIVASGYAQIRKGVDLFIYTANYIKKHYRDKCKFVWVGDGFNPKSDFAYSLWLEREIKHLGLKEDFLFLEHQKNLDAIFEIADIFCLTSRMDPFPNVVIDALEADLPIACFRDASGSVEFLENHHANCIIADYMDTYQLGKLISSALKKNIFKQGVNKSIVENKLNFQDYMNKIMDYIEDVKKEQYKIIQSMKIIKESKIFDNGYYGIYAYEGDSIANYVNVTSKNLYNSVTHAYPKPGFNDLLWKEKYPTSTIPFVDAIKQKIEKTHNCLIIPRDIKEEKPTFKYAVHLHLYYTELTNEFAQYFKNLSGDFDILISVISDEKIEQIRKVFKHHTSAQNIIIKVVENIGRDIGPMLFEFKDEIMAGKYEVIGHFHSKRSLSTDNNMGNRWRRYLLDNLVGSEKIVNDILNLFTDEKIGLVFAEDRHCVNIGNNKEFVDSLAQMMEMPNIKETVIFPLGNMFWARVDAIKDMCNLEKKEVLQEEPIPYDGSFMHALERITPNMVQKNNYKYITVYQKGTKW